MKYLVDEDAFDQSLPPQDVTQGNFHRADWTVFTKHEQDSLAGCEDCEPHGSLLRH